MQKDVLIFFGVVKMDKNYQNNIQKNIQTKISISIFWGLDGRSLYQLYTICNSLIIFAPTQSCSNTAPHCEQYSHCNAIST